MAIFYFILTYYTFNWLSNAFHMKVIWYIIGRCKIEKNIKLSEPPSVIANFRRKCGNPIIPTMSFILPLCHSRENGNPSFVFLFFFLSLSLRTFTESVAISLFPYVIPAKAGIYPTVIASTALGARQSQLPIYTDILPFSTTKTIEKL